MADDDETFSTSERIGLGVLGVMCLPANWAVRTLTLGTVGTGANKMVHAAITGKKKDFLEGDIWK